MYYRWKYEFIGAARKHFEGDNSRVAIEIEIKNLKELTVELSLENETLKKKVHL